MVRLLTITTFLLAFPFSAPAGIDVIFDFIAADTCIVYNAETGEGGGVVGIFIAEDLENPGFPNTVSGWSMGNMLDSPFVQVTEIELGDYLETINDGDGPDFFATTVLPNGFTVGCVYNLLGGAECSYEVPKEAVEVTVMTVAAALIGDEDGATADMIWVDTLGTPPVVNSLVPAVVEAMVEFQDGVINLVPLVAVEWSRGDCNDDGVVNIADGVWTLNALFQGGDLGDCLAACDMNSDGSADMVDAIYCFNYRFLDGPEPGAPFPACGTTGDEDDCEAHSSCPETP